MKTIILTKGYSCEVDDDAPEEIFKFRWKALEARGGKVYAVRNVYAGINDKTGKKIWKACLMHRLISGASDGYVVDHKDGNTLNNCKINLRVCSQGDNRANSMVANGKSNKKGVYWNKQKKKWQAQIGTKRTDKHYLGRFDNKEDAAKAYDEAAVKLFGEFACTNKMISKNKIITGVA